MFDFDICVVGGCGRVGLPLSIAFADKGLKVAIHDVDKHGMDMVGSGVMPFLEEGCEERLRRVIGKRLMTADSPHVITQSRFVITTIGTPIDEHLNPRYAAMITFFRGLLPYLVQGHYIIIRSTVYPGTTERVNELLKESFADVHVTFCPERIAEGKTLSELESLPQIVSGFDQEGIQEVCNLFRLLTEDIVVLQPIEAELGKLFTNAWRYIQFSVANQFFMLANQYESDFHRIHAAITYKYPRTQGLPKPGFAAGPCLFKDTAQLVAFSSNSFFLGQAAMLVNEGLPNYVIEKVRQKTDLRNKSVGILGMAFKPDCDDERDSLSFKLKRILEIEAREVYCTDPYVKRDYFVSAEQLVDSCDVIIVATPHEEYRTLNITEDKMLVDVWDFYNRGGTVW